MYRSNMATGHLNVDECAIRISYPCLYWSVLLCGILIFIISGDVVKSHAWTCINSSKRRNPLYAIRHAAANCKFARVGWLLASLAISCNICGVISFFFSNGCASICFSPCNVACTRELTPGESMPARLCTQDRAFTASSAADFDFTWFPMCCKYNATLHASVGKTGSLCALAHNFHRLNAPKYFLVDESALLLKTVASNF